MERHHIKNKELFSAVIHEVKNSLNPVINLSSILLRSSEGRFTNDENSYLEVIERNGRKILNLIEEISFLNKLSGREKKHSVSSVPVRETIDNAVMNMMSLSSGCDFSMSCEIDNSLLIAAEKDVFRKIIESICLFFLSACDNAASVYFGASVSGSKFNLISSTKKTSAVFTDFDLYENGRVIEKGFSRSSEMWLSFAVLYIHYLKGTAWFSADSEGNPVFSFTIPAEAGEAADAESVQSPGKDITCHHEREFIMLVIDDDVDNIIPVNAVLEHEFRGLAKVYHAENGAAGLDMLENVKPDIILLDLTLPDISGLSLVRNIKHLFVKSSVPVIAFTGLDIASDKEKMLRAGFDDVIKKPFNIDAFVQKIREWID